MACPAAQADPELAQFTCLALQRLNPRQRAQKGACVVSRWRMDQRGARAQG